MCAPSTWRSICLGWSTSFGKSIVAGDQSVTLSVEAVNAWTSTDRAVAIGMIATELITNAVKYAYPEGGGEVRLRLARNEGGGLVLTIEDDGVGLVGGAAKGGGLGGRIVEAMTRSLGARVEYETPAAGARAVLRLNPDLFIDQAPREKEALSSNP